MPKYRTAHHVLAALIVFLISFSSVAQKKAEPFEWPDAKPPRMIIKDKFSDEDAVYLFDKHNLTINGAKADFMFLRFTRHFRVKLQNEKAVEHFSEIRVPESLAPAYDYRDVPLDQRDERVRPRYYEVNPLYFEARIIKKDGAVVEALPTRRMKVESRVLDLIQHRADSYWYSFFELEEGDQLEVFYKYEIPYDKNWFQFNAGKVYFHGKYPKQKYEFVVDRHELNYCLFHGVLPDERLEDNRRVLEAWRKNDLPGAMGEVGAKPHLDVEHLSYSINILSSQYRYSDRLSGMSIQGPYWVYLLKQRENKAFWWRRVARKNFPDRQNVKVNAFIEKSSVGIPDSLPHQQAVACHMAIVELFDYQLDDDYRAGLDQGLEKIGDHMEREVLREISRYNVYSKIFAKLRIPYNTVYFMDNRIGRMNKTFLGAIHDQNYAFVFGGQVSRNVYMYPKQHRFGYETDELPFYWEGTKGLLNNIDLTILPDYDSLMFVQTPVTDQVKNVRKAVIQAEVDPLRNRLSFKGRLYLSGQFSTMTRGVYLHDYRDSSIQSQYHQRLYDLNEHARLIRQKVSKRVRFYPFDTSLNLEYEVSGIMVRDPLKGVMGINLTKWFNHLYIKGFTAEHRDLPFYADFAGKDEIRYFLTFKDPVKLKNRKQLETEITNSYGKFSVTVEQVDPHTILILSTFNVDQARVLAGAVEKVAAIHNAAEKLDSSILWFKILGPEGN